MTVNTEVGELVDNELDFVVGGGITLVTHSSTVEEVEAQHSFIIRGLARILSWF